MSIDSIEVWWGPLSDRKRVNEPVQSAAHFDLISAADFELYFYTGLSLSRNGSRDGNVLLGARRKFRPLFFYEHFNLQLTIEPLGCIRWGKFFLVWYRDWKVICSRFESPRIPLEPVGSSWKIDYLPLPTCATFHHPQHLRNLNYI